MTAQLADQICLWAAVVVPVPLVVAFRWSGVALGALAVWGILWLAGVWVSSLDPTRDAGMLDSVWLLFGWAAGLLYCLPILGVREAAAAVRRRRRAGRSLAG